MHREVVVSRLLPEGGGKASRAIEESGTEDDPADVFEPLTREEAEALRRRLPMVSPWQVIAVQSVAGVACVLVAYMIGGERTGGSALYGAAAVVLPQAVLARGLTRGANGNPVAAAFGFMVWEFAKIGLAVAMLVAFAKVVAQPSWPALLATMVVCTKTSWLALLWQRGSAIRKTNATRV